MGRAKRKSIGLRTRFAVLAAGGFRCHYCGRRAGPEVVLQLDHRIPVSAGGTDDRSNLVASCTACNQGKSDVVRLDCEARHRGPFTPTLFPTSDVVMICVACDHVAVMLGFDGRWSVIGSAA